MKKIIFSIKISPWDYIARNSAEFFVSIPKNSNIIYENIPESSYIERFCGNIGSDLLYIKLNEGDEYELKSERRIYTEFKGDIAHNFVAEADNDFILPNEYLQRVARRLKKSATTEYECALLIYNFILENMEYSYPPDAYGATEVIKSMKGDCLCYSQLYTALCKCVGIPVRTVFGWLCGKQLDTPHVWNEILVEGRILSVDVSLGQNINNFIDRLNFLRDEGNHFGFVTQNHLILSYGHMHYCPFIVDNSDHLYESYIKTPSGLFPYGQSLMRQTIPWIQGVYPVIPKYKNDIDYIYPFNISSKIII